MKKKKLNNLPEVKNNHTIICNWFSPPFCNMAGKSWLAPGDLPSGLQFQNLYFALSTMNSSSFKISLTLFVCDFIHRNLYNSEHH